MSAFIASGTCWALPKLAPSFSERSMPFHLLPRRNQIVGSRGSHPSWPSCWASANGSSPDQNVEGNADGVQLSAAPQKRVAVLKATKFASLRVQDRQKPLANYMTLPASQYSVLDAKRIERLDSDTFRCYVGGLHFFKFHVEPVLTVSVTVEEKGPTVKLLATELKGSRTVVEANKKFTATMENIVKWRESEVGKDGEKEITSDTSIQVTLEVPGWLVLPVGVIERSGCAVMQRVLDSAVPKFLQQLSRDYALWAEGNESRTSVASDELI